jgi:RNA polymerase sporulation-specific sigma factor
MMKKPNLITHDLIAYADRLARAWARRTGINTPEDVEDLIGAAHVGLAEACATFDPTLSVDLRTWVRRNVEWNLWDAVGIMFQRFENEETWGLDLRPLFEAAVEADLNSEYEMLLEKALPQLDEREYDILRDLYGLEGGDELTQEEIADKYGISQATVSRIHMRALKKLEQLGAV